MAVLRPIRSSVTVPEPSLSDIGRATELSLSESARLGSCVALFELTKGVSAVVRWVNATLTKSFKVCMQLWDKIMATAMVWILSALPS